MSATKETTIWCDVEGCVEWVQIAVGRTGDARQEARMYGWRYASRRDLCPEHAQEALDARKSVDSGRGE